MYQNYEKAVSEVMTYLASNTYTSSIVYTHIRCYRLLKEYLQSKEMSYSRELALQWLDAVTPGLCHSTFRNYRLALSRVNDILNHHEIRNTKSAYEAVQNYQHLNQWSKELLDEFLAVLSKSHGSASIHEHRISASRFLAYLARCGVKSTTGINHSIIMGYYRDDIHKTQKIKDHYNSLTRHFLMYLADKGMVMSSIPLTLDKFIIQRLVLIHELPPSDRDAFCVAEPPDCMKASEFHLKAFILGSTYLKRHRYSATMKKEFRKTWNELFVFLEANGLDYCQETALCWAKYMQYHTVQWKTFRRAVKIFEQSEYWRHSARHRIYVSDR